MSKRKEREGDEEHRKSKKSHKSKKSSCLDTGDSFATVHANATLLIEALQNFQLEKSGSQDHLASVVKALLPSFKSIASGNQEPIPLSSPDITNSQSVEKIKSSKTTTPENATTSNGTASNATSTLVTEAIVSNPNVPSTSLTEGTKKLAIKDGLPIPWFLLTTPWTMADVSPTLPPLPYVAPDLHKVAFTHQAIADLEGTLSYERLEWIGDSYLHIISSTIIFQTFGMYQSSQAARMREELVRNATLCRYFLEYGMGQFARVPAEKARVKEPGFANDKSIQKIQGDMFEAFVAAAIFSDPEHGIERVAHWLKLVWARTIKQKLKEVDEETMQEAAPEFGGKVMKTRLEEAKTRLAVAVQVPGVTISYKEQERHKELGRHLAVPEYTMGVYITGYGEVDTLLATASAYNKSEAGQKAALKVLDQKKVLKKYEDKKKAFLAARAAAL